MKTIAMTVPRLPEFADGTALQFPDDFMMPYTILIREAFIHHEKAIKSGPVQFNFPGHGVLYLDGRNYRFEFDAKYAARKGYEKERQGVWA